MRIEHLLIEDFRSIRSVELTEIPDIAVFYGKNGSGKSNVLDAIELAWKLLELVGASGGTTAAAPVDTLDLPFGTRSGTIRLAGVLNLGDRAFNCDGWRTHRVEFDLGVRVSVGSPSALILNRLEAHTTTKQGNEQVLSRMLGEPRWDWDVFDRNSSFTLFDGWCRAFRSALHEGVLSVPEVRGVNRGQGPAGATIPELALQGYFEAAAYNALVSPDAEMLARLDRLKTLMTGPPLSRPPFRPVLVDGQPALQEVVQRGSSNVGIPLTRVGLGVQQLYPILGSIMLAGAPIVLIEEPEAHLHAMSSGRDLRAILLGLVPGTIHQLFVATHSELFDLNPYEYYDVRMEDGETKVVRRTDLVNIDDDHTYSPGAARHALMDALGRGEPDRFVFERADGTGVRASEMIQMLVEDTPEAFAFLKTVTRSAVRAVTVKAHKHLSE